MRLSKEGGGGLKVCVCVCVCVCVGRYTLKGVCVKTQVNTSTKYKSVLTIFREIKLVFKKLLVV